MRLFELILGPDLTMRKLTADEIALARFERTTLGASDAGYGRVHDAAYGALTETQRDLLLARFLDVPSDSASTDTTSSWPSSGGRRAGWWTRAFSVVFGPSPSQPLLSSLAVQATWFGFIGPHCWGQPSQTDEPGSGHQP